MVVSFNGMLKFDNMLKLVFGVEHALMGELHRLI